MAPRPPPSARRAAPHAGGLLQVRGAALSSQERLQAQPWCGAGTSSGNREALPLEQVAVPKPTPGTGTLCCGSQLWPGQQEGHTWQVAIQWLTSCEVSAPPL